MKTRYGARVHVVAGNFDDAVLRAFRELTFEQGKGTVLPPIQFTIERDGKGEFFLHVGEIDMSALSEIRAGVKS